MPPPLLRRTRPALKRRTAVLILMLGVIILVTGALWLGAAIYSARLMRLWGFDANAVIAPGVGFMVVGGGLIAWYRIGTRPR